MKDFRRKGEKLGVESTSKELRSFRAKYGRETKLVNFANESVGTYPYNSKEKIREQLIKSRLLQKMEEDFSRRDRISQENELEVRQSFEQIFEILFPYQPDHLGLEYTNEHTLYIFAKVKAWDIHLETDFEEEVFCTLSVFEADEIALNKSDTVENCLMRLSQVLGESAFPLDEIYTSFPAHDSFSI